MSRNDRGNLLLRACYHFSRQDRTLSDITDWIVKVMIKSYNRHFMKTRNKKVRKLQKKGTATVLFVCPDYHSFALSEVYRLMMEGKVFRPIIGVTYFDHIDPSIGTDADRYGETIDYFRNCGFEVTGFGQSKEEIRRKVLEIDPDIIFFNSTMALSSIAELEKLVSDRIRVKVSYGYFLSNLQQAQFNGRDMIEFDYLLWEAPATVRMSRKYAVNGGVNSYYLGYPKLDGILYPEHVDDSRWKPCEGKRIIWAPHHSIEDDEKVYGLSCFLLIAEFMLYLAESNHYKLQIAFKPHPLLKHRLYHHSEWGKEKTDQYYNRWDVLVNGQLVSGDYDRLFLTSDAMIMDSISFMCEYAAVNKPCLFTVKDVTVRHKFNELGTEAFDRIMYRTSTDIERDIERFIEDVVIHRNDYKKKEREKFMQEELLTPNGKKASENIVSFFEELVSG